MADPNMRRTRSNTARDNPTLEHDGVPTYLPETIPMPDAGPSRSLARRGESQPRAPSQSRSQSRSTTTKNARNTGSRAAPGTKKISQADTRGRPKTQKAARNPPDMSALPNTQEYVPAPYHSTSNDLLLNPTAPQQQPADPMPPPSQYTPWFQPDSSIPPPTIQASSSQSYPIPQLSSYPPPSMLQSPSYPPPPTLQPPLFPTLQPPPADGEWADFFASFPDTSYHGFEFDEEDMYGGTEGLGANAPSFTPSAATASQSMPPPTASTSQITLAPQHVPPPVDTTQPMSYATYLANMGPASSANPLSLNWPVPASLEGPSEARALVVARETPQNVLTVARNKRSTSHASRRNPYDISARSPTPSVAPTVQSSSSSRRPVHTIVDKGVQIEVFTGGRRSGKSAKEPILSANDRLNIKHAGNIFIAKSCQVHCWPLDGDVKGIDSNQYTDKVAKNVLEQWVREACTQANAHAVKNLREETTLGIVYFSEVRRYASRWRGLLKRAIILKIAANAWGTELQGVVSTEAQVRYRAERIQELLVKDSFCDMGLDDQGESELFNHPAFQSIIIEEFYGEQGIARLVPGTFKHLDVFPEPAMALVRFLIRIVMSNCTTGKQNAVKLDAKLHRGDYIEDLLFAKRVTSRADPYNRVKVRRIQKDLATRGRAYGDDAPPLASNSVLGHYAHIRHDIPLPLDMLDSEDEGDDRDALGELDGDA
ncbi:hypothetical protein HWV62_15789 [Athelia sp. TMB]|nr:hypothetical protein HWV62_15789 [Athelia sp. TMB]